jgi:hypothetical protein
MHNRFFDPEGTRAEVPRRVYALFDQREDERILLEAVDADWFEDATGFNVDFGGWVKRSADAPVSVLQVSDKVYHRWCPVPLPTLIEGHEDEVPDEWIEIGLDPAGEDALIYLGLFAAAIPVGISFMQAVPAKIGKALGKAFDLTPFTASQKEISNALNSLTASLDWVGVYDVGQGSANGLCDEYAPLAYFDLGGGVLANKNSFPSSFSGICLSRRPPVILSHWDWDHWSSGARFPGALALSWIVPNQKLGAVHGTMAASIAARGRLLVWPTGLGYLSIGQVTIEKCVGTSGRNSTGLAVLVDGPHPGEHILLSGDARYSAIPSGLAQCLSVVVPHHGGDMKSKATPVCSRHAASRAAYSYGPSNSFNHPRQSTHQDHHANGWAHRCLQHGGTIDRHTPDLRPSLGHIALGWVASARTPLLGCRGARCSLQLVQR